MPGISDIQEVDQPHDFPDLDASKASYRSPDGSWELIFSHPGEIAMGASVWGRAALCRGDKDVSSEHPALIPTHASINALQFFHPWNHTSTELVVPLMSHEDVGAIVYDVSTRTVRQRASLSRERGYSGLIWSPTDDLILLLRGQESEIVSGNFAHIRSVPFGENVHSTTLGGWTPSGRFVFSLCRERSGPSVLRFLDDDSGIVADVPFDAEKVLPYDKDQFRELSSRRVLIDPDRGVSWWMPEQFELFFGQWMGATYSSESGFLSAWAYRPTLETLPYPEGSVGDGVACVIRPRWIRARLTDED